MKRRLRTTSAFLLATLMVFCVITIVQNIHHIHWNDNDTASLTPLARSLSEYKRPVSRTTFAKNITSPEEEDATTKNKSSLYWNLSCPAEMSIFSASHMGGDDYLQRALKARQLVLDEHVLERMQNDYHKHIFSNKQQQYPPRRIFFVGDSLMRQVFISMACLLWNYVESHQIVWFQHRTSRSTSHNTFARGKHSKFHEARILLTGGMELVYHHGIGGLLELGQDYKSHETESWLHSCGYNKVFRTSIPKIISGEMDERMVERTKVTLTRRDVVLVNGSVHGARHRDVNLSTLSSLIQCMSFRQRPEWPRFAYIMTGVEHFPTVTGAFDPKLLEETEEEKCRQESTSRTYQEQDVANFDSQIPILAKEVVEYEYTAGDLHVGGKDCLHWIQPGIPDLIAANVSSFIATLTDKKTSIKK